MLHAAMRLLVATLLAARSAGQRPSGEGDTCAGHADCAAGLYCTQGEECGLCRDDEEEPCAMWGDSIDGSCAVCGDGPDLAASASGSSATVDEADQDVADADDGDGQQKKSGRRKGGRRRKQGVGSGADARNAGAEAPFLTVPGAFTPQELDRVRREAALIPAVHSNAGITGKRNVGTKESEIRGLSRERFSWVYEKMRKLVHETNAAQWWAFALTDSLAHTATYRPFWIAFCCHIDRALVNQTVSIQAQIDLYVRRGYTCWVLVLAGVSSSWEKFRTHFRLRRTTPHPGASTNGMSTRISGVHPHMLRVSSQ